MAPGDRVLYAGVGAGEDAAGAASMGVAVTAVELSRAMCDRAARRFERDGVAGHVELIHGDMLAHHAGQPYDAVVTNFFLNVFDGAGVVRMLSHLWTQVRPGGQLLIADYKPRERGAVERTAQWLYHSPAIAVFSAVTGNALHDIHDYRPALQEVGFELEAMEDVAAFGRGPRWYRSLVARRPAPSTDGSA